MINNPFSFTLQNLTILVIVMMMVMIITSQRTKGRRGDHTNNYDYGGGGDGGDNDKSVDVPWSILSPFPKPQCLRKFFLQFFKLEISFWDRCTHFFCSNSTLNWKKLYVWPQKNLLCNFSRKIVLGKEKPTIGWRLHRSFITLRDFPKLSYVIMILMELMMIYILWCSVCLCVTKNEHFLLGVSCNHLNPP